MEIDYIFGSAILGVVSIPRGEVYTELESCFFANIGKFSNYIAFTVFPRGVFYRMFCVF